MLEKKYIKILKQKKPALEIKKKINEINRLKKKLKNT